MYELMYGFGSFWLITGPVLDELMAKSEVERLCIDLQDGAQRERKNYYSNFIPIRTHVLSEN